MASKGAGAPSKAAAPVWFGVSRSGLIGSRLVPTLAAAMAESKRVRARHIDEEENEIFPRLGEQLGESRLPAVSGQILREEALIITTLPEGFVLRPDFLDIAEEAAMLAFLRGLRYGEVRMHGVAAKRRVAQFGWHYSFESFRLSEAPAVPDELAGVRARAAEIAGVDAVEFAEVLATEYPPGAGIGWHRDAPPFGIVAGVSLGAACRMRFRRGKVGAWETAVVVLPPRSIYLLTGPARKEWQHTIPAVTEARWSLTFRTVKRKPLSPAAEERERLS